jgi:death-on-curing protein
VAIELRRLDPETLVRQALQAPLAGFGDIDLYSEIHQRLGVLCSRVVLNHPFVDRNKRTGFLLMMYAAHLNGNPSRLPRPG